MSNLFREGFSVERSHDYGKFMLMGVMLWAYLSFSQYLIIWSAQLPEEMVWYHHRRAGIWPVVGISLILFQFALPFCLLLSRQLKKTKYLMWVAFLILGMRFVDLWWWVGPAFHPNETVIPLWGLVATLAIGGLWLSGFAHSMTSQRAAERQGV
jgi:hypothetical protein